MPQGLLGEDYKPAQWHTPTGEEVITGSALWALEYLGASKRQG